MKDHFFTSRQLTLRRNPLLVIPLLLGIGTASTTGVGARELTASPRRHRTLQPIQRPSAPSPGDDVPAAWRHHPVDRFIIARMREHGLTPSPRADRYTLIRRVTFDLTGLPPTPKAIDAFVLDPSPNAYEFLVERLLSSQHYGERWGQHWLDIAGYADSNGYWGTDTDRPLAYKYRDYVIESFNRGKPFDQFIEEQIAGDERVGYSYGGDLTSDMVEALTATHFLRNAADGTGESDGNPDEVVRDRYAALEGTVEILGSAVLGLTVQCARCHDHKLEPLTSEEYYQLQAILKPAYNHDQWLNPNQRVVQVGLVSERGENEKLWSRFHREAQALSESLEGLMKPYRALAIAENLDDLPEETRVEIDAALAVTPKKRTPEMKALLKDHEERIEIKDEELFQRFPGLRSTHQSLQRTIQNHQRAQPPKLPELAIVTDFSPTPPPHHLLRRGNYNTPVKPVEPGTPACLTRGKNLYRIRHPGAGNETTPGKTSGRRLAFARWLTSRQNPTFSRLMVNRVWMHHFQQGLVASPDNLGLTGSPPSHPELLDYLAAEFMEKWNLKDLHRLIVNSATYQQTSRKRDAAHSVDPLNRFLWRYPLRRLESEAVRDAMLFVSGELDSRSGGPYVPTTRTKNGKVIVDPGVEGANRRSIYLQRRRTQVLTLLEAFDQPTPTPNCTQRKVSTVVLQPLAQLNSDFALARSRAFACRLLTQKAFREPVQRIRAAFLHALGYLPDDDQIENALRFLESQAELYPPAETQEEAVWTDFCQMLLASNGFLYLK